MNKAAELKELGYLIKSKRTKMGLSQSELANNIGKDRPSITRVESGKVNPSYIYLLEICEGLEIPIHELFLDI